MGGWRRWWFGDIASVFAPAVDRGPRAAPTRRSARWLIGIGLFITLFGVIGATESAAPLEHQDATVVGLYTTTLNLRSSSNKFEHVRLRLENGDTKVVTNEPLYKAIGGRLERPVKVDVDPDTDLVDAVYLDGRRYGLGKQSAAVVISILFAVFGLFLLLRGIGRYRRYRLTRTDQPGGPVEG